MHEICKIHDNEVAVVRVNGVETQVLEFKLTQVLEFKLHSPFQPSTPEPLPGVLALVDFLSVRRIRLAESIFVVQCLVQLLAEPNTFEAKTLDFEDAAGDHGLDHILYDRGHQVSVHDSISDNRVLSRLRRCQPVDV